MELNIPGFDPEYTTYEQQRIYEIDIRLHENRNHIPNQRLVKIGNEFKNLDVKMRLAFGIREIQLNNRFVNDKQGALKECHLLYYKVADLWFAYETFIKFLEVVLEKRIKKIEWLGERPHAHYSSRQWVPPALATVNIELGNEFGMAPLKSELIKYLQYCEQEATGAQKTRLGTIIPQLSNGHTLTHTEVLTIIYSIRNNFVHNGETTVVPDNFSFENKAHLLRILYPYLCILLLSSVNQAILEI